MMGDFQDYGMLFYIAEDSYISDPNRTFKFTWESAKNPISKKNWKQMILRLYVQYTSPYALLVRDRKNNAMQEQSHTFNHVAVFETQLKAPPIGSYVFNSLDKW